MTLYFGGKGHVVSDVWSAFGNVKNYAEPFAGSLAVLLGRPHQAEVSAVETVNDLDCVSPETRVLKADMAWVPSGEIHVGDRLLAFDEHNGAATGPGLRAPSKYRRFAHATVTSVHRITKPCYRLTFDDGTVVVCSSDHLWLGGSHRPAGGVGGQRGWRWLKTSNLVCDRAEQRSWILKICDVTERENSFEAGWLSGFYDGEGHVSVGPGLKVVLSQNTGHVLDHAQQLLEERGIAVTRSDGARLCQTLTVTGGKKAQLDLLMRFRPERLIRNFISQCHEVSLYGREHRAVGLVTKEFLGDQEVIAIETDSRTYIAEGLASHNCNIANFFRAVAADPLGVVKFCDLPVTEVDLLARQTWLVHQDDFRAKMLADPDFFDVKVAGWWVWGISCWVGGGFCAKESGKQKLPALSSAGMGVNALAQHGELTTVILALQKRLRHVRVACGDWSRILTPAVLRNGPTGVLLDPPYDSGSVTYAAGGNGVAQAVRDWAVQNGDDRNLRIALCGYQGDYVMPKGWTELKWTTGPAYNRAGGQNDSERIWFSPHCLRKGGAAVEIGSLFQ